MRSAFALDATCETDTVRIIVAGDLDPAEGLP
jgi:hypothetical protein